MIRQHRAALLALWALFLPAVADALPFAVGHRSITYVDPSRGNRQVQTEVYYPAEQGGDDVPVAAGAFPVIAFGHGFVMVWSAYAYIWSSLAPHGYLVALPRTEGGLLPSHEQFARDLAFLVDQLRAEGATPGSFLDGHVAETACVMGHSMGGGASVLGASYNPQVTAVANLAAAETNPSAIAAAASVTVPCLLLAGSLDCVTPPEQHQIPIYEALASTCRTLVTLNGATHCQFADYNFNCELGEFCSPTISREQQHLLVESLLMPWLDWILKADGSAQDTFQELLLAGQGITSVQDCPEVSQVAGSVHPIPLELRPSPNPFTGGTRIRLSLPTASAVRAEVFDLSGRRVRFLLDPNARPGTCEISWDGKNEQGRGLPAGTYLGRVTTEGKRGSCVLTLLR